MNLPKWSSLLSFDGVIFCRLGTWSKVVVLMPQMLTDTRPDSSNDFISGNRISMWADKSGNTNNPIQSMANQMPKWTPATPKPKSPL